MAFNYNKLKGRIIEKFGSQNAFAEALGTTPNTISLKLNNKIKFNTADICKYVELLDIDPNEINLYFFEREKNNESVD